MNAQGVGQDGQKSCKAQPTCAPATRWVSPPLEALLTQKTPRCLGPGNVSAHSIRPVGRTAFQTASESQLALPVSVLFFRKRALADVIKLKGGHQGEAWYLWCVPDVVLRRGRLEMQRDTPWTTKTGWHVSKTLRLGDSPAVCAELILPGSLLNCPFPGLGSRLSASGLGSRLPASATVGTQGGRGMLFKPPSLWYLFWQPEDTIAKVRKSQWDRENP